MTEAEWLTCTHPWPMLDFLRGRASKRKLRLFAVACCRNVLHRCSDDRLAALIEIAERYADGLATNSDRSDARRAVHLLIQSNMTAPSGDERAYWEAHVNNAGLWAVYWAFGKERDVVACCGHCALVEGRRMQRDAKTANVDQASAWRKGRDAEWCRETVMLRDIFGNPFRPVPPDPWWRTPGIINLAQTIYESKSFDRMPVVADALEEAGCANAAVLSHCQELRAHARGCWVLDLVLGKE